jgi:hypothetical protein
MNAMTNDNAIAADQLRSGQIPLAVQSLCSELSRSGQLYLRHISALIDDIAPHPGSLVYLHASNLGAQMNGLDPVVYSAVDACSNLQLAQIHPASTAAAALSFIDVIVKCFPFSVRRIRTDREFPLSAGAGRQVHHDVRGLLAQGEILHSFVADRGEDALYSLTSRILFTSTSEGAVGKGSELRQYRPLMQFLLYHNNYRSIPWLNGNTPLQRLKSYEGFATFHSFAVNLDGGAYTGVSSSGQPVGAPNWP